MYLHRDSNWVFEYRANALTTKLRRHMVKNMLFTSMSQAMDILVYPKHLFQGVSDN